MTAPPADPITVMPFSLAICTTAEPTAPAAADTKTISPDFASAVPQSKRPCQSCEQSQRPAATSFLLT